VLAGRGRQHRFVRPVGDVEGVLHAHHRGDLLRFGQLVETDRAQVQVPDQACCCSSASASDRSGRPKIAGLVAASRMTTTE
jgi:hypothetical protein